MNDENDDKVIQSIDRKGTYKVPDERVDCVVDIYSAGILLFMMMLKTKPITDVEMIAAIAALKNHRELPEEWNHYPQWQLRLGCSNHYQCHLTLASPTSLLCVPPHHTIYCLYVFIFTIIDSFDETLCAESAEHCL